MGNAIPGKEEEKQKLLRQARHLVYGLERISADSRWARRSSGYRGALLKQLDWLEEDQSPGPQELAQLERIVAVGYEMLIKAAREIGVGQEFERMDQG